MDCVLIGHATDYQRLTYKPCFNEWLFSIIAIEYTITELSLSPNFKSYQDKRYTHLKPVSEFDPSLTKLTKNMPSIRGNNLAAVDFINRKYACVLYFSIIND